MVLDFILKRTTFSGILLLLRIIALSFWRMIIILFNNTTKPIMIFNTAFTIVLNISIMDKYVHLIFNGG